MMRYGLALLLIISLGCVAAISFVDSLSDKMGLYLLAMISGLAFVECLVDEIDCRIRTAVSKKRRKR